MSINWGFGTYKYFRPGISPEEIKKINSITVDNHFTNDGDVSWLDIYLYPDGEYVVCLNQLGEAYYEGSEDNKRFGESFSIRLEQSNHVIQFIKNYIMKDKYFTK